MNVLSISKMDTLKSQLERLGSNRKLIGVGVVMASQWQVALIDVTEEVELGFFDTSDPQLVNSFVHCYGEEIRRKIEDAARPLAFAAKA
ncbi:MAG: hypothetical protein RMM17_11950 [Acidobacteriota bacterium]|nr:hypothetical protein [Blastocatellia bacterium]MDW8413386.1 hypothetical protein [Acidobacteriota bacterium]